jgi:hypothetical protein
VLSNAGTGLALGAALNWYAIPISSLPLALVLSQELRSSWRFALSQIAYMGVALAYTRSAGEPEEKAA